MLNGKKTLHHEDEHEGSGIPVSFDYDQNHIEVINYRLSINPPIEDFNPYVKDHFKELSGLLPGTEYRVELFAVLSSGAETDLVETSFKTLGENLDNQKSDDGCGVSIDQLNQPATVISECDFEGNTLCGWSQVRLAKSYSWRIDVERAAAAKTKSKVLLAPFNKNAENDVARLTSPSFSGVTCLSLEVLMFRRNVQSFKVKVKTELGETTLATLSGPQGDLWVPLKQSIFLPNNLSYQIILESLRGSDWKSAISVDNLRVTSGPCWLN